MSDVDDPLLRWQFIQWVKNQGMEEMKNSEKTMESIAEISEMLFEFFKDNMKVSYWMNTKNPLLGNVSPMSMILIGRVEKLKSFIKSQLAEDI